MESGPPGQANQRAGAGGDRRGGAPVRNDRGAESGRDPGGIAGPAERGMVGADG